MDQLLHWSIQLQEYQIWVEGGLIWSTNSFLPPGAGKFMTAVTTMTLIGLRKCAMRSVPTNMVSFCVQFEIWVSFLRFTLFTSHWRQFPEFWMHQLCRTRAICKSIGPVQVLAASYNVIQCISSISQLPPVASICLRIVSANMDSVHHTSQQFL